MSVSYFSLGFILTSKHLGNLQLQQCCLWCKDALLQSGANSEQRAVQRRVQRRLQRMPCAGGALLSEKLEPRSGLPPLLTNLGDRPPESSALPGHLLRPHTEPAQLLAQERLCPSVPQAECQ